jgi:CRP/FNR family transcriptional regulator
VTPAADPSTTPPGVTAAFVQYGVSRRLRRGMALFRAGAPVPGLHLVESGHLRIVRGGQRSVVLHHEGPGGMLGETALFGGTPYPATALASEPTTCLLLPRVRVMDLLSGEPEAAAFFLRRLANRLHGVITRLDGMSRDSVAVRLSRHLAARAAGTDRAFTLGMTQAELAEELGTVREVLVRELRRLTDRGAIVSTGRGMYRVSDPRVLAETAAGRETR